MAIPTRKISQTASKPKAKIKKDPMHGSVPMSDYAQMLAFKLFFHGKGPAHYVMIPESDGCALSASTVNGALKTHSHSLLAANAAGMGVFMAINTVEGNGSVADNKVAGINAVFIDADGTMELAAIKELNPHLIVRTSPKKYHAYWLVEGLQVPMFKTVQKALAGKFGTDTSVNNPGRVMRMPGTIHQKASPVLAKIVHKTDDAKPVPYKRLLHRLGVIVEEAQDREAVTSDSPAADSELRSALFTIPVANDRETWLKVGMAIQNALPNQEGYALWEEWSKQSSTFQAKEQRKAWGSFKGAGGVTKATLFKLAQRNGWRQQIVGTTLPVTEFQMVDEFANQVTGYLRYETTGGKWMLFESPVWLTDEARAVQASRRVVEPMIEQAATEGSAQALKVLGKYSSIAGVRTLLREASARPDLNVSLGEFDRVPHLLAVQNGVIDLRTAEFRAGQAGDMLRCQTPTKYDPDAKCPLFMAFLKFITCGRKEFAAYLQRALGYTLYGHTNEQVFFIAHGDSGNGKGTLFRLIGNVVGPFAKAVSPNLLSRAYAGNPNASSSAIMALNGPRMLQCGEGEERHRFDTAFIKQLIDSAQISLNFL